MPCLEPGIQPYVLATRPAGLHLTASPLYFFPPAMPLPRQDTGGTTVIPDSKEEQIRAGEAAGSVDIPRNSTQFR